jgi:uncharacterized protein (TIGR03437 family)
MRWLLPLLLAAAGPLAAQPVACGYSLNTGPYFLPGSSEQSISSAINVVVTAGPGYTCSWSIGATASWIHILSLTITGTGSIPFTLDANNSGAMRNDVITFTAYGLQNPVSLPIYQLAGNCAYALSPQAIEIPVGGSTNGVLQVTTGCSWSISSNQSWLSFTLDSGNLVAASNTPISNYPGATNYGNGKANYTVAPNGCATPRNASLTVVTGVTGIPPALAISQDGSPGNLALSPAAVTASASGATGRITVTTGSGCAWNAVSNANWLGFTGASSGNGPGTFVYNAQANTGPARTGSIQVGPQTFTVTQQAAPPPSPQLTAVENGASDALGVVSPGEIVTFWGANLGPTPGVRFQLSTDGKSIPNTLAGVTVLFDGTPATLLYVSAAQVNAIVPYGVAGNPNTVVTVQYQGQTSNAMTVAVQAATPGIFSQDSSGSGPGAILNWDSSLNTSLSPAAMGSAIQIFATGGGVTNPAQTDGALAPVTPPLPLLAMQPVVTIGGLPAKVDYAGAAPGEVAGLTQINAEVPAGVTPGLSVPVVVQIGNWRSQPGLTITVK